MSGQTDASGALVYHAGIVVKRVLVARFLCTDAHAAARIVIAVVMVVVVVPAEVIFQSTA